MPRVAGKMLKPTFPKPAPPNRLRKETKVKCHWDEKGNRNSLPRYKRPAEADPPSVMPWSKCPWSFLRTLLSVPSRHSLPAGSAYQRLFGHRRSGSRISDEEWVVLQSRTWGWRRCVSRWGISLGINLQRRCSAGISGLGLVGGWGGGRGLGALSCAPGRGSRELWAPLGSGRQCQLVSYCPGMQGVGRRK